MRIAVVGGGISGLVAAHLLSDGHEVTLFEAEPRLGGHTRTLDVTVGGQPFAVDTGFIVFNRERYPTFTALLDRLGVASRPTTMEFSVACERTGLEYNPSSFGTLFAQRRNLLSPSFWRMALEILRFRRAFPSIIAAGDPEATLADWLRSRGYSERFVQDFLVPLGASLWSAAPGDMERFPLGMFVAFFDNHGFLRTREPYQWRTVAGGSRTYVAPLAAPFARNVRLATPVERVERRPDHVLVQPLGAAPERFGHVVLAVHSDQALRLLADATPLEREVLGALPYQENDVDLHTDTRLLPRRRAVWASWNYRRPRHAADRCALTYDMSILQGLQAPEELLVTLNSRAAIDPTRLLSSTTLHHPVYTTAGVKAQRRWAEVSGAERTHFCGAYWGFGFHEDGAASGLAVARRFGRGL